MYTTTIAAISTPIGTGGISIIRISGDDAFAIISKIFNPKRKKDMLSVKTHTIHFGEIIDGDNIIDEVLVSIMHSPNTFTRENIAEINCHGGMVATNRVLEVVLKNGAHLAEPGEFTKRAFLNGRLDLSQAEAVIDIINSKTDLSRQSAVNQLEGSLLHKINALKTGIIGILSHIEVNIDYPEYDIEQITNDTIKNGTSQILNAINQLLSTTDTGKIVRDGIPTAIVGKPNVGKSSLLNALIRDERAIVTDIAGTTRDTIEEYVNLHGVPLKLIDTAGIRDTEDTVEKIGVERSRKAIDSADLVLFVLDISNPLSNEDRTIYESIQHKKHIVVLNKSDLPRKLSEDELLSLIGNGTTIDLSASTGDGIHKLEHLIKDMFLSGNINVETDIIVTNTRHKNALLKAHDSLSSLLSNMDSGLTQDFLSIDLQNAYRYLGEITGESVSESMINDIFSRFCLGK